MITDARMKRLASWAGYEIWMRPALGGRWIWIVRPVAHGATVGGVAWSYEGARRAAYPALAMAVRGDDVRAVEPYGSDAAMGGGVPLPARLI